MPDQQKDHDTMLRPCRSLGRTGLSVSAIGLGTMQFGWTLSSVESMVVLDRYRELGGNLIDTANMYGGDQSVESFEQSRAHVGMSEEIIGRWLQDRSCRDDIVLSTKVRARMWDGPDGEGLGRAHVTQAVDDSLRRLRTDHVEVLYAHWPEPQDDDAEFLGIAADLIAAGKVRFVGTSNFCDFAGNGDRLSPLLELARQHDELPMLACEQPRYNLLNRAEYEGRLQAIALEHGLGVVTYSSLASGFLTGEITSAESGLPAARGRQLERYCTPAGWALLDELTAVAARHDTAPAAVALAWLLAQPGLTSAIIGPQSVAELDSAAPGATIALEPDEIARLTEVSWWASAPEFVLW